MNRTTHHSTAGCDPYCTQSQASSLVSFLMVIPRPLYQKNERQEQMNVVGAKQVPYREREAQRKDDIVINNARCYSCERCYLVKSCHISKPKNSQTADPGYTILMSLKNVISPIKWHIQHSLVNPFATNRHLLIDEVTHHFGPPQAPLCAGQSSLWHIASQYNAV